MSAPPCQAVLLASLALLTLFAPTLVMDMTMPMAIAPMTIAPVTIAPVTIAPMTIAPVTIAPVTIAPMTITPAASGQIWAKLVPELASLSGLPPAEQCARAERAIATIGAAHDNSALAARIAVGILGGLLHDGLAVDIAKKFAVPAAEVAADREALSLAEWQRPPEHWAYSPARPAGGASSSGQARETARPAGRPPSDRDIARQLLGDPVQWRLPAR